MKLIFIRHGETLSNKEKRYLGKTDEALSEVGKEKLLSQKNRYPEIDCLFVSPMKRCIETAEIIYPGNAPIIIPEWEEIDFGDFEGKNYLELQDNADYQKWIDSNGKLPFPNGEGRETFLLRCMSGFEKMLLHIGEERQNTNGSIGIVVHGGTIMALLSTYGEGDYYDYQASNGAGYKCILNMENSKMHFTEVEKI